MQKRRLPPDQGLGEPKRKFEDTFSAVSFLAPHAYSPSVMHMGDCAVCGHLQGAPIHRAAPAPSAG